jgi:hypothetical protein
MKTIKYQSKRVTVAADTYSAQHISPDTIDLDKSYDRVTGVAIHRVVDSGVASTDYKIGLSNDNGVIHDPAHIDNWATARGDGTNPNERFKELNVGIREGGNIGCQVVLPAQVLGTALQVEFVFRLEKDNTRIN